MRHNVQDGLGNCIVQDAATMLHVTMDSIKANNVQQDTLYMSVARMYDLQCRPPLAHEHDYADIPNKSAISAYKLTVIHYIAGYVVRMVKRKIKCCQCQLALTDEALQSFGNTVGLQFMMLNNRGLVKASPRVILVCCETEKCFQRIHHASDDKLPQTNQILSSICIVVLKEV